MKNLIKKYKAADSFTKKMYAWLFVWTLVAFPWMQTAALLQALTPEPVVVAQVDTRPQPIVESNFFLTKTTWPDYRDTVSAEQFANQSQYDRTHLGPSNHIEPAKPIVTVVTIPTYVK